MDGTKRAHIAPSLSLSSIRRVHISASSQTSHRTLDFTFGDATAWSIRRSSSSCDAVTKPALSCATRTRRCSFTRTSPSPLGGPRTSVDAAIAPCSRACGRRDEKYACSIENGTPPSVAEPPGADGPSSGKASSSACGFRGMHSAWHAFSTLASLPKPDGSLVRCARVASVSPTRCTSSLNHDWS